MLIITRKVGESVSIQLDPRIDPRTPVGEVLSGERIDVLVARLPEYRVCLGVSAPSSFIILRGELQWRTAEVG